MKILILLILLTLALAKKRVSMRKYAGSDKKLAKSNLHGDNTFNQQNILSMLERRHRTKVLDKEQEARDRNIIEEVLKTLPDEDIVHCFINIKTHFINEKYIGIERKILEYQKLLEFIKDNKQNNEKLIKEYLEFYDKHRELTLKHLVAGCPVAKAFESLFNKS